MLKLIAQLPDNRTYLLHCGQSSGNQGKTQHVIYHAHLAQHGLYACRVAIDKQ